MTQFEVKYFQVGQIMTNCYLMINKESRECIVIDPGDQADLIKRKISEADANPVAILLTHGHFDHIMAMNDIKREYGIEIYAHEDEKVMFEDTKNSMLSQMGITEKFEPDHYFHGEPKISFAGFDIQVLFTPGHTPGGVSYYFADQGVLFSGDTLFHGSVGRTDFPGGSASALMRSVEEKLFVLPDDVVVYPGHESSTSIGWEKKYNPFF